MAVIPTEMMNQRSSEGLLHRHNNLQFPHSTCTFKLHVAHGTRGDSVEFEIESKIEKLVMATW